MKKIIFMSMAAFLVFNGYAMETHSDDACSLSSESINHDGLMSNQFEEVPGLIFSRESKLLRNEMLELATLQAEQDIWLGAYKERVALCSMHYKWESAQTDVHGFLEDPEYIVSLQPDAVRKMRDKVSLHRNLTKIRIAAMKEVMKLEKKHKKIRKNSTNM